MADTKIPCRVCEKLFIPCKTIKGEMGEFNWRSVACCYEHGMTYFRQIVESRVKKTSAVQTKADEATPCTIDTPQIETNQVKNDEAQVQSMQGVVDAPENSANNQPARTTRRTRTTKNPMNKGARSAVSQSETSERKKPETQTNEATDE